VIRWEETYLDGELDETERNGSEQHNWITRALYSFPDIKCFQGFGDCDALILHARNYKCFLFWCQPTRLDNLVSKFDKPQPSVLTVSGRSVTTTRATSAKVIVMMPSMAKIICHPLVLPKRSSFKIALASSPLAAPLRGAMTMYRLSLNANSLSSEHQ